MRVLVIGASGAIGTRIVPQLIHEGHDVVGTATSARSLERIRALGAEALALDLLDRPAVGRAVRESRPDAIVHQATALADANFSRSLDRSFGVTNRLRREGTDALLAAVARHLDAMVEPRAVLGADDVLIDLPRRDRPEAVQHRDLVVANDLRPERPGRLHRGQAERL